MSSLKMGILRAYLGLPKKYDENHDSAIWYRENKFLLRVRFDSQGYVVWWTRLIEDGRIKVTSFDVMLECLKECGILNE